MKVLQIETTNYCNACCIMCIHKKIKEFGTMNNRLFKKILNNAKSMKDLKLVIPMLTGEPFLDPDFVYKLKLINKILPKIGISIYTNCSLLNPKLIKKLAHINNLNIYFSLNGACKETRKELMGLNDYKYAVKMINLYAKTNKPFKVLFVAHSSVKDEEFHKFKRIWGNKGGLIICQNFAGEKYESKPKISCIRAIDHMTVLWNGKVNLCCFDALGKTIFGDLNKQTVKEVWNSPKRQAYVKAHLKGEIIKGSLCENCSGG